MGKTSIFSVIICIIFFSACNKLNQENYGKISLGMKRSQINEILGIKMTDNQLNKITPDASVYFEFDNDNKCISKMFHKKKDSKIIEVTGEGNLQWMFRADGSLAYTKLCGFKLMPSSETKIYVNGKLSDGQISPAHIFRINGTLEKEKGYDGNLYDFIKVTELFDEGK